MFEQFRIDRLRPKLEAQQALVQKLEVAEKEYGSSYYTDKYHREFFKLVEMQSRMRCLEDKLMTVSEPDRPL